MQENHATEKKVKSFSLRFLLVAALFLIAVFIFGWIADEMVLENENGLDKLAFHQLATLINPSTTKLMLIITFFGSAYFLTPAYLLLIFYFLFFKKKRKLSLDVTVIGVISTIILFSLKAIFHRHRPLDPLVANVNGFSFPSGHSFSSFTFFGLLIYILWNHKINSLLRWILTVLFFLFACAIAVSRVYLHVHYASDVVAGFFLCFVWLSLSLWLLKKFDKKLS
jgi:membrane-associated phospholipid phosphatase